jgi:hypothetical protein
MITAPASVTRFYGNTRFGLDVLENQQITLVRVTMLNDPFDPYGFFETDFGGYMNLLKYVQTQHAKDRGWFRNYVTAQSWGRTERDLKAYMARLRKDTFVLCASAPAGQTHLQDNLYMWGHYGNGHRGLAIGTIPLRSPRLSWPITALKAMHPLSANNPGYRWNTPDPSGPSLPRTYSCSSRSRMRRCSTEATTRRNAAGHVLPTAIGHQKRCVATRERVAAHVAQHDRDGK